MSEGELDTGRVMKIINHPVRLRIIELLATKGPLSWKELSGELGIRTGSLYHHLDTLERIVTRNPEKKYVLTKLGQAIYANVSENPSLASQNIDKMIKKRGALATLLNFFVPRSLILVWTSTRARAVTCVAIFSSLVLACLYAAGDSLVMFSFSPASSLLLPALTYLGSLLLVVGLSFVSIRVFFKERSDPLVLLAAVSLSFFPVTAFGLTLHSLEASGALGILGNRTMLTLVFAIFQAWGAGIMGAGMSVASGLRIEKTLVVSLVLLYATMVVVFVQGGVLT